MRRVSDVVALLCLLAFPLSGFASQVANCPSNVLNALSGKYGLYNFDTSKDTGVIDQVCKEWPYKKNLLLLAFVYDARLAYTGNGDPAQDVLDLYVGVYDLKHQQLISSYTHKVYPDRTVQVGSGSLSIDTATYDLASGIRAFGLRFDTSANAPSGADAWDNDYLTLFVIDHDVLHPALGSGYLDQGVALRYVTIAQGCMKCMNNSGVEYGDGTVYVLPTLTNGFHDLCVLYSARDTDETKKNNHDRPSIVAQCGKDIYKYNGRWYTQKSN